MGESEKKMYGQIGIGGSCKGKRKPEITDVDFKELMGDIKSVKTRGLSDSKVWKIR